MASKDSKIMLSEADLRFDREHLWHPYTSLTKPLRTYPIGAAKGIHLELDSGEKLIDGMSSWWTAIHGYNHPKLNQAVTNQLAKMAHVMFGGITHKPAIDLGKKLIELTPDGLDKIFYADSGSVSVEVAMKMAVQYQHAQGRPERKKFLTTRFGYHGDTTAAMSVCDPVSGMHQLFTGFVPEHIFGPAFANGFDHAVDTSVVAEFDRLFDENESQIAAFIVEPIVQGAGGMRIYNPAYLTAIKQKCEQYDILFIADEIATGFGRTGRMFAMEYAGFAPDILCLGKALTGGYMTMAATLTTERVSDAICSGEAGVFMHGPTFMANPLACAVSLASLRLIEHDDCLQKVKNIHGVLDEYLSPAQEHSRVKSIRVIGAIGVIECHQNINVQNAQKYFVDRGVWIRPFRNLIYIMPPYIISDIDLKKLCKPMVAVLDMDSCFN